METFFDIVFFPITALVWLISHWQLVLFIVVALFLWAIFYPMYQGRRANLALEEAKDSLIRTQNHQLEVENQKYAHGSFDFKRFISNIGAAPKSGAIFEECLDKVKRMTAAIERGDSDPDAQILHAFKADLNKNNNSSISPVAAKSLLTARSRLLQTFAYEVLMRGYYFGSKGYIQDYAKSYEYAKKIENVSADAIYFIGSFYLNGYYLEKNYEKAFEYLICAAIAGDPEAHDLLGDMYRDGTGRLVDKSLAFAFYNIACSLKQDKDEWRDKRNIFAQSLSVEDLSKGQALTSMIIDSNYSKLFDIGVLPAL